VNLSAEAAGGQADLRHRGRANTRQYSRRSILGADPMGRLWRLLPRSLGARSLITNPSCALSFACPLSQDPGSQTSSFCFAKAAASGWIKDALGPLHKASQSATFVGSCSLRATLGIEALVWLTDVAGVSREQASVSCVHQPELCFDPQ